MNERREGVQRAPRSGGRTTEQRVTPEGTRRASTSSADATSRESGSAGGVRGARYNPTRRAGVDDTDAQRAGVGRAGTGRGDLGRTGMGRGGVRDTGVEGTAALKLNVSEPLREADVAPRLRVAPPAPISAPRAPFAAAVIALVVVGVFGILMINTRTNLNAFEISTLEEQKAALDNQEQQLRRTIAGFDNTGNLDAAARKLGLIKSDAPAYIRLPDGKIIGVPKPGTGKPSVASQDAAGTAGTGENPTTTPNAGTGQNTAGTAPVAGG